MANNYMEWSAEFAYPEGATPVMQEWLEEACAPLDAGYDPTTLAPWRDDEEGGDAAFDLTLYDNSFILTSEAPCADVDKAVLLVQAFWKEFGKGDEFGAISWCVRCDKMRPDQFGGGVVAFTKDTTEWRDTSTLRGILTTRLSSKKSRYQKDWAVITDTQMGIDVTTYKHEADARRIGAEIAMNVAQHSKAFNDEERVTIKALWEKKDFAGVMELWTETVNEYGQNEDWVYVEPCKRYTRVA